MNQHIKHFEIKRPTGTKFDKKSLAKQIFDEQVENEWPGLAQEAKLISEEFHVKDVTKEWKNEPTKIKWKVLIKEASKKKTERDLKKKMAQGYSKIKDLSEESFERKGYLSEMNMSEARMFYKIRTKMVKAKMNFSSDYKNRATLWKCDSCCRSIDTQAHIKICPAYEHLREGKSLDCDKDLVQYFKEVLSIREKNNFTR